MSSAAVVIGALRVKPKTTNKTLLVSQNLDNKIFYEQLKLEILVLFRCSCGDESYAVLQKPFLP